MSTNSIHDILEKKGLNGSVQSVSSSPKKRRRRLYETIEEIDSVENVEVVESKAKGVGLAGSIEKKESSHDPKESIKKITSEQDIEKEIVKKKVKLRPKRIDPSKELEKIKGAIASPKTNYTAVPNKIIEKLLAEKFTEREMKFILVVLRHSLGWKKSAAFLRRDDFLIDAGIPDSAFDKIKKSVIKKGAIGSKKISNKSAYFLKADFFNLEEHKSNIELSTPSEIEEIILKLDGEKVQNSERISFLDLIKEGKDPGELSVLAQYLLDNGDHKGEVVSKPFAYLQSGAIQSVRTRLEAEGTKVNSELVYKAISEYNTREPLPESVSSLLSQNDLEWIQNKGGRHMISQMTDSSLRAELGLN